MERVTSITFITLSLNNIFISLYKFQGFPFLIYGQIYIKKGTELAVHVVEVNGDDYVGHNEKKGADGQDQIL